MANETQQEELKAFIQEELESWVRTFIAGRIAYLTSKKKLSTGQLIRSFEYEINRQAKREVLEALVAFEDYGRMLEMKRFSHDKWGRNNIDRLADWVERTWTGANYLKFAQKRKLVEIRQSTINSIAWGILVNRTKTKKRTRWYNKPKTAQISELFNQVAASIPSLVGQQITKSLHDNGSTAG